MIAAGFPPLLPLLNLDFVYSLNTSPTSQKRCFSIAALYISLHHKQCFALLYFSVEFTHASGTMVLFLQFRWEIAGWIEHSTLPFFLHFIHPISFFHEMDLVD